MLVVDDDAGAAWLLRDEQERRYRPVAPGIAHDVLDVPVAPALALGGELGCGRHLEAK
jgi:hypothetical protein